MSVKVMGLVWDMQIGRDEKLVLLAYADHADHDGHNIFPAVKTIAHKTGYSDRSVQRITRKLIENGMLIENGTTTYGTNKYSIPIYGDKMSPRQNVTGDTVMSPPGDTVMSPESSFNHPLKEVNSIKKTQSFTDMDMQNIFIKVTGMITFPASSRANDIERLRAIAHHYGNETQEYLKTYWDEWNSRKYSKSNTSWLDWAVAGDIPQKRKNGKSKEPAELTGMAAVEEYRRIHGI